MNLDSLSAAVSAKTDRPIPMFVRFAMLDAFKKTIGEDYGRVAQEKYPEFRLAFIESWTDKFKRPVYVDDDIIAQIESEAVHATLEVLGELCGSQPTPPEGIDRKPESFWVRLRGQISRFFRGP